MSGLEPLVAFSLACGIMQVISFGCEVAAIAKSIRRTTSPDPSGTGMASRLLKASEALDQSLREAPKPLNKDEQELLDVAGQCRVAAAELSTEMGKIYDGSTPGSRRSTASRVGRMIWNRHKIEGLEKILREHRETLDNRLLQRVCTRSDAILLQQSCEFAKLDGVLRHFIEASAAGESRLAGLISKESKSLNDHMDLQIGQLRKDISSESSKNRLAVSEASALVEFQASWTRNELSRRFDETIASQTNVAQQHQVPRSLAYDTMNTRRNIINEPHEGTFEWIFGPKQDEAYSDTDQDGSEGHLDSDGSQDYLDPDDFEGLADPESDSHEDPLEQLYWEQKQKSPMAEVSRSFLSWLRFEGPSLYWISGKAGSGKSTLMWFLVDNLPTRAEFSASIVLSHFLWMAGQPMERNIKGILCSLLHQLLRDDPILSQLVLDRIPNARHKNAYGDWHEKELRAALEIAFSGSQRPIIIFLDGLDEIDPSEGVSKVLDLVDKLRSMSQIRICVSSRPDPAFQQRLHDSPTFRLQDLTWQDIWRYTLRTLRPCVQPGDPVLREIVQRVCEKSNGVFLWVALAVKSLQGGMGNDDPAGDLLKRLEALPDELNQLYESMWKRLNQDQPIYGEDGAQLLNFVLASEIIYQGPEMERSSKEISTFTLMLARNTSAPFKILAESRVPRREKWSANVENVSKLIRARCAGLLDIHGSAVRLIHRSAKEFLENTPQGQRILESDKSTVGDRLCKMAAAEMALTRLQVLKQRQPHRCHLSLPSDLPTPPAVIVRMLHRLFLQGHMPAAKALEMMSYAESLHQTGMWYPMHYRRSRPFDLDFLGIAVSEGFVEFVVPALDRLEGTAPNGSLSASYKSYLVATACVCGTWHSGKKPTSSKMVDLIALLLERWADIGQNGIHFLTDGPDADEEGYLVPCTAMMALCRLAFFLTFSPIPCIFLEKILRLGTGGSLEDVMTFVFMQHWPLESVSRSDTDFDNAEDTTGSTSEPDTSVYSIDTYLLMHRGIASRAFVFIEANMSYVLDLYLRILSTSNVVPAEGQRRLSAEVAKRAIPRSATVWHLALGASGGDSTSLNSRPGTVIPMSEADGEYLLEGLANIRISPDSQGNFEIPGMARRIQEVAMRGEESSLLDLESDLETLGHIVAIEDVESWPPKPWE